MRSPRLAVAAVVVATTAACGSGGSGSARSLVNRTPPPPSASAHPVAIPKTVGRCVVPTPVTPPEHPLTFTPKIGCWGVESTDLEFPLAVFKGPVRGRFTWESGGVVDDNTGEAVAGARVVLRAPTLSQPLRAITDKRGQYAFLNIPLGHGRCLPVVVRVMARGYKPLRIGPEADFRGAGQRSITISKKRNLTEADSGCVSR